MEKLVKQNWSVGDFGDLDEVLSIYSQPQHKKTTAKLLNTPSDVLGVSSPNMRNIVKVICKGNVISFLDNLVADNYEKTVIYGMLITKIKDETVAFKYFAKYLKLIDNWACADLCADFVLIDKNPEKHWEFVKGLALSSDVWTSRCGIVLMLKFYRYKFFDRVFEVMDCIKSDEYYINMAQAWLISTFFIDNPDRTLAYLKSNKLNDFTQNKSIQKINESFRISEEHKAAAVELKRNRK